MIALVWIWGFDMVLAVSLKGAPYIGQRSAEARNE